MTKFTFLINEESVNGLNWEEFETFEMAQEGKMRLYKIRPILARFLLDDNGAFIEHKKAMDILGKVPVGKIKETITLFIDTLKGSSVPKASGSPSQSPSEVPVVDSVSPVGSQP